MLEDWVGEERGEEEEGVASLVGSAILDETFVVAGEVVDEDDGGDVGEAVEPFAAFGALAADVDEEIAL